MSRFFDYDPNQAYLVPPNVKDVLSNGHLCFFVHRAVEQFDLREFEAGYGSEGGLALSAGDDAEGVVVRVRAAGELDAAAGAADPGGLGVSLSGGRVVAGP